MNLDGNENFTLPFYCNDRLNGRFWFWPNAKYGVMWCTDPYVKVWLIQNGRRIEKKKTPVLKRTLDPQFNETMTFNVSVDQMRYTSLQVHVMDYDRIGRNEEIGRVVLGPKTRPSEVKHWNEMLSKAKLAATRWHVLRDCNWFELTVEAFTTT